MNTERNNTMLRERLDFIAAEVERLGRRIAIVPTEQKKFSWECTKKQVLKIVDSAFPSDEDD